VCSLVSKVSPQLQNAREMMEESGLKITHATIMRGMHQYSPIIDERIRKHLKPTNDSWRMDEPILKLRAKMHIYTLLCE